MLHRAQRRGNVLKQDDRARLGNAQKLVIAREFARIPQLVIVHSPSRGLDVRATLAVH